MMVSCPGLCSVKIAMILIAQQLVSGKMLSVTSTAIASNIAFCLSFILAEKNFSDYG